MGSDHIYFRPGSPTGDRMVNASGTGFERRGSGIYAEPVDTGGSVADSPLWDVKVTAAVRGATEADIYEGLAAQLLAVAARRRAGNSRMLVPLESDQPVRSLAIDAKERQT